MFYGCQSQKKAILGCLLNVAPSVPSLCPPQSGGVRPPTPQESRARWRRWGSSCPRRLCKHRGLNSAEVANVAQYLSTSADGMALQPVGKMPGSSPPAAIPKLLPSLGHPGPATLPGAVPAGAAQPASHSSVRREPCPRRRAAGWGCSNATSLLLGEY